MIDDIGAAVLSLCREAPGGLILFFASYAYEEEVMTRWADSQVLAEMQKLKKVYREQRGPSRSTEEVLLQYYSSARGTSGHTGGALLSCVMGGKLSEGINFADELARCVCVVGMPFPNKNDPILKERMACWSSSSKGVSSDEYLLNKCMKTVNQSIGRCIRHAKDYASIVLADGRYSRSNVFRKLPLWLRQSVDEKEGAASLSGQSASVVIDRVRRFFSARR